MPPPTPKPSFSFDTGTGVDKISIGGSPADANIAASSTHVCITARAAFACYAKDGTLVSPGPGFSAQPYKAQDFFQQSGVSVPDASDANTPTKDGRVVFDPYRRRFFMAFQTRLSGPLRLLIAVSKSEDPQDGWWTYEDMQEGGVGVNGQDYMWMGVNASHLLITNRVTTINLPNGIHRHLMYTTEDLVAGKLYSRTEWSHAKGDEAVPCVHNSYTTDAFWVRREPTQLRVFGVRQDKLVIKQVPIKPSVPAVNGIQKGGDTLSYGNIGRKPQNAEYRDGKIVFVSNDGHAWPGQPMPNNCVRLVRLDVSKFFVPDSSEPGVEQSVSEVTAEIDLIFGRSSPTDRPGSVFDYGWPAVATNAKGDIVVGSVRPNPTIHPELRASVLFAGESDISPDISLKTSSQPLRQFHMAGACVDPGTDAIYLAQQYGDLPSWRIHVARMLG